MSVSFQATLVFFAELVLRGATEALGGGMRGGSSTIKPSGKRINPALGNIT